MKPFWLVLGWFALMIVSWAIGYGTGIRDGKRTVQPCTMTEVKDANSEFGEVGFPAAVGLPSSSLKEDAEKAGILTVTEKPRRSGIDLIINGLRVSTNPGNSDTQPWRWRCYGDEHSVSCVEVVP